MEQIVVESYVLKNERTKKKMLISAYFRLPDPSLLLAAIEIHQSQMAGSLHTSGYWWNIPKKTAENLRAIMITTLWAQKVNVLKINIFSTIFSWVRAWFFFDILRFAQQTEAQKNPARRSTMTFESCTENQ